MTLDPNAFHNDPYGHAASQSGHYAVGVTLALCLWPFAGVWSPLIAAALYGAIWEVWRQGLPDWRDGLDDTVHVLCGAGVATLAAGATWVDGQLIVQWDAGRYWPLVALHLAWVALLAVGVWRRR